MKRSNDRMCNLPFVSVIVPVYNGEGMTGECIESLPEPEAVARAVLAVAENLKDFGVRARNRAVKFSDIQKWYARHEQVFADLLSSRG